MTFLPVRALATDGTTEAQTPQQLRISPDFAMLKMNKGTVVLSASDITSGTAVVINGTTFNDASFLQGLFNGIATASVVASTGLITIRRPGIYHVQYNVLLGAEDVDSVGIITELFQNSTEAKEARGYVGVLDATGGTAGVNLGNAAGQTFLTCAIGDTLSVKLDFFAASAQKAALYGFCLTVRQMTDSGTGV